MKVELKEERPHTLGLDEHQELVAFMSISSIVYTGYIDGSIACIWGLIPPSLLSDSAHLWLHTNDLCHRHPFLLVRYSQRAMESMLEKYPTIVGYCDLTKSRSVQWLRWLGAEVGYPSGNLAPFVIRA